MPKLRRAVLRLGPDADRLSLLPGRLSVDTADVAARRAGAGAGGAGKVEPEVETAVLEPETISLEEVEEVGEDVAVEDEEIIDLGEDEAEIPAAGDEDTFLEEPEGDEEADVSGIVSGPGAGEEG